MPAGHHLDKLGHFALYAVLGLLMLRAAATARPAPRIVLSVLTVASLFGAADEWHQRFIPGRSQDAADWLADTLGAGSGVLAVVAFRSRREPLA